MRLLRASSSVIIALLAAALVLVFISGEAKPAQGAAKAAPVAAPSAAPVPARRIGEEAERYFAELAAEPLLTRSISLEDMGFLQPVVFSGADAERQIFFAVPRDLHLHDARLDLTGTHLKAANGRMTMLAELGGRPIATLDFDGNEGRFLRPVPVPNGAPAEGFLRLGLKFAAIGSGDRCTDQRSIGNVVTLDPATRLSYRIDPRDVHSVRSAWSILPYTARILVSGEPLTAAQFDAAARMALAIHTSGRKPVFTALPRLGDWISTAPLRVPQELAELEVFRRFIDAAGKVQITSPAERGAYAVLLALSGQPLGDVAVDTAAIRRIIDGDLTALRQELVQTAPAVEAALARWLDATQRQPQLAGGENLSLGLVLGFPQLQLDTESAPLSSALLGSRWQRLARSEALSIREVKDAPRSADFLPLSQLSGGFAAQAITDYGEWAVSFNAAQLPPERWPTAVELELRVAPDSADVAPVASVMLNDTLLRAQKVDPASSVLRMTADIPYFLLGANNTLKISLQRGALSGDCKAVPRGYLAQLLPTSRISLSHTSIDGQFFGLLPRFANAAAVYIPTDYLQRPAEALPFTVNFLQALSITSSSLRLAVVEPNQALTPDQAFVAFGSALKGVRAGVEIGRDRLTLAGDKGEMLLDLSGAGDVAIAQIGEIDGTYGVLVDTRPGAPLPVVKLDQLANGDVAVIDATGIIAELGAAERKADAVERALYEPAALAYRYREYIIAGLTLLAALVLMRIVRGIAVRRKRAREQAKAGS